MTAQLAAREAKKLTELIKAQERDKAELESKKKLLGIETRRGFSTAGTRVGLEQIAGRMTQRQREIDRLR